MRRGLVIVNTGDGKGKTTAALGMLLRAWGRDFRLCVIQFIKAESGNWGEVKAARKLEIEWHKMGDGFTWLSKDMDETIAHAQRGWALAQEKITSGPLRSDPAGRVHLPAALRLAGHRRGDRLAGCATSRRAAPDDHRAQRSRSIARIRRPGHRNEGHQAPIRSRHPGAGRDRFLMSG